MEEYMAGKLIAEMKGIREAIESLGRQANVLFGNPNKLNKRKGFHDKDQQGEEEKGRSRALASSPRTRIIPKEGGGVKRAGYPEEFEAFWQSYPPRGKPAVRNGKQQAYMAWKRVPKIYQKALDRIAREQSERGMLGSDPQFYPMASTWLNRKRYEDVAEGPKGQGMSGSDFETEDEQKKAWEGGWGE